MCAPVPQSGIAPKALMSGVDSFHLTIEYVNRPEGSKGATTFFKRTFGTVNNKKTRMQNSSVSFPAL